jgi:hypothetical protein
MQAEQTPQPRTFALRKADGVIFKNGQQTVCPFTPRVAIPVQAKVLGKAPEINFATFPCATYCPKCNVMIGPMSDDEADKVNAGVPYVQISCGGTFVQDYVDIIEENKIGPLSAV